MAKISPPLFGEIPYELYKLELLAWEAVTDVAEERRGIVVALSLPNNHESKIKEKVFESITLDSLKDKDGLKTLITFLDGHLLKDSLEEAWLRFEDFEDCKRRQDESVVSFINEFDRKYQRIKAKGVAIPDNLLAFKLLKGAGLSREERLLVMTGINLDQQGQIYDEAQKSLKKFKGDSLSSSNNRMTYKEEPTFATVSGYSRPRRERFRNKDTNPTGRDGKTMTCSKCFSIRHLYNSCPDKSTRTRPNPMSRDGKHMTCNSCFSIYHFVQSCPHRWEAVQVNTVSSEIETAERNNHNPFHMSDDPNHYRAGSNPHDHVVLFTGNGPQEIAMLGKEVAQMAVIDSACSSNVAGKRWMEQYIESLSDKERGTVEKQKSDRVFKFGGGTRLLSQGEYIIPGSVAGKSVKIRADVVDSDIPLLLSRNAMKTMGCRMNFEDDTANIFGETMNMNLTTSGHYCIPVGPIETEVNVVRLCQLNKTELTKQVQKLHRQFGHPSEEKFRKLLRDAGCDNPNLAEIMNGIYKSCKICKEHAPTPPKPAVCMPLAQEFNKCVAMDLKQIQGGHWILYIIDVFTRYTMAQIISRKRPSTIIEELIRNWIAVFGVMESIITDNGGEFTGEEIRDVASLLNIRVLTTGAESPFQNGLCERVHAVTDSILSKLQAQFPKTPLDLLVAWACMAKNSLQMFNGFSANQLVFGRNPNLPGILTDAVPAMEENTISKSFATHINALHAARRAFIESESEERVRRALRSKLRVNEQSYKTGDKVYYKRDSKWMGPGTVLGQDGKIIFVRHGSNLVRVSANRILDAKNVRFDSYEESLINPKEIMERADNPINSSGTTASSEEHHHQTQPETSADDPNTEEDSINSSTETPACEQTTIRRSLRIFNQEHVQEGEQVYMVTIPKSRHGDEDCVQAKEDELNKLRDFEVYDEVPNFGQNSISTRWILWKKGDITRARLVARGFEETMENCVDSPTIGKCVVRIVLCLAASHSWTIKSTDIKSAFLQGLPLEREVYIKPPQEANLPQDRLWKLKKCLYGLNDAARQFYDCVKQELLQSGCKTTSLDPSLFFYQDENGLSGVIVSHIDDFLHCGNQCFEEKVINKLCSRFHAGSQQAEEFKYVGYQVTQNVNAISNQKDYIENAEIPESPMCNKIKGSEPLAGKEITIFRSMVGMLNWVVQSTRPDLAFDMIDLSTKFKCSTKDDLKRIFKIIIKLKEQKSEILFPGLGDYNNWKIVMFSDASYGNLSGGVDSCGGFLIFLTGQNKSCPIVWKSGRVQRVVKSTLAAEGLSLTEGLDEAIYIRQILCEIFATNVKSDLFPIIGITDHEGLCRNIRSTKLVEDRRLRVDLAGVKQNIVRGEIREIKLCPSSEQLADVLTKKGVSGDKLLSVLQTGNLGNIE